MAKYNKTSPYTFTPVVNDEYLDILVPRPVPVSQYDLPYVIESQFHQRPDLASDVIYGTPKLWWVFAQRNFNVLKDPVFDFRAGTEIFVNEPKTLMQYLGL